MKISKILEGGDFVLSAEVFPPKRDGTMEGVIRALKEIKTVAPDFVSVTYGAGGKGGATTADVASIALDAFEMNTLAHLTAVNMTESMLNEHIAVLLNKGIENVLTLRGDVSEGDTFYDFAHASDLAEYISARYPQFELVGACYPEGHSEAPSLEADLINIKKKIDVGVKLLISQLFFSNDTFYRFMDKASAAGIDVPIIAGVMPIVSENQINRIVKMCGVEIPSDFAKLIATTASCDLFEAGTDYAIAQIEDLRAHGVRGAHIYTMNKGAVAVKLFDVLKPQEASK